MYVIQVCWSDGSIRWDWFSDKYDKQSVIREAKDELNHPAFEGDYVRIITVDGELVWDSRKNKS